MARYLLVVPEGFRSAYMGRWMAQALGAALDAYSPGPRTYHLRRLRVNGVVERPPRPPLPGDEAGLECRPGLHQAPPELSQLRDGSPKAPDH